MPIRGPASAGWDGDLWFSGCAPAADRTCLVLERSAASVAGDAGWAVALPRWLWSCSLWTACISGMRSKAVVFTRCPDVSYFCRRRYTILWLQMLRAVTSLHVTDASWQWWSRFRPIVARQPTGSGDLVNRLLSISVRPLLDCRALCGNDCHTGRCSPLTLPFRSGQALRLRFSAGSQEHRHTENAKWKESGLWKQTSALPLTGCVNLEPISLSVTKN